MDQKVNPIQAAPSVDDLLALGTDSRVGQVDFATRLVAVPDPAPRDEEPAPETTTTTVLPRRRVVEAVPDPEADVEVEAEPEAETEVEAVVEAVVEPEPVVEDVPAKAARVRKPAAKTAKPRKPAAPKAQPRNHPSMTKPTRPKAALEPTSASTVTLPPVAPPIMPIANLSGDPVAATPASSPTETAMSNAALIEPEHADRTPTRRMPAEPVRPAPAEPVVDDSAYLGATVQAVADAALERLRDAENATLHHLAALEAEAARRAELLTAQAELDAELIRITARREAHAIISAARTQAGLGSPSAQSSRDSRQLAEISDAVSRFAESIESTLTPMHSTRGDV